MSANPAFIYQPPQHPYLDILYQDDAMVVINKPSGLLSVPGKAPEHRDSVITRVNQVLPTATVVHRLDMATSGIMVLALHKQAHRHISRQFELRQTAKRYFALVDGIPNDPQGDISLPLICDWPNRPKQKVCHETGKQAHTHYRVVATEAGNALVELTPITGRSHQLRVHMLALGHPILGDRLYGCERVIQAKPRLQLHAESLRLSHPDTQAPLLFQVKQSFCAYQADAF
jgi:tRNA pseudouridine32 synthase/23S rRNA pseudouridine746 synthase